MPRLTAVELVYGTEIDVRLRTSLDLAIACDTAVLQVVHASGTELGIRIERGRVSDVYLWDARLLLRQHLPEGHVRLEPHVVTCSIPRALVTSAGLDLQLAAALSVNGTPVQTHYPVSVRPADHPSHQHEVSRASRTPSSPRAVMATAALQQQPRPSSPTSNRASTTTSRART